MLQLQYRRVLRPDSLNKFLKPGKDLSHFLPTQTELRERKEAKVLWKKRFQKIEKLWNTTYDQQAEGTEEERIVATRREM